MLQVWPFSFPWAFGFFWETVQTGEPYKVWNNFRWYTMTVQLQRRCNLSYS